MLPLRVVTFQFTALAAIAVAGQSVIAAVAHQSTCRCRSLLGVGAVLALCVQFLQQALDLLLTESLHCTCQQTEAGVKVMCTLLCSALQRVLQGVRQLALLLAVCLCSGFGSCACFVQRVSECVRGGLPCCRLQACRSACLYRWLASRACPALQDTCSCMPP